MISAYTILKRYGPAFCLAFAVLLFVPFAAGMAQWVPQDTTYTVTTLIDELDGDLLPGTGAGTSLREAAAELVSDVTDFRAGAGFGVVVVTPGVAKIVKSTAAIILVAAEVILEQKKYAEEWGVAFNSGGADYAEWLEREDPNDKFVFGDIVGVHAGKISRRIEDADITAQQCGSVVGIAWESLEAGMPGYVNVAVGMPISRVLTSSCVSRIKSPLWRFRSEPWNPCFGN
ncbi:MAG: hypothetical protein IH600_03960 [Bacteroidetes bacterium]|nr:hypothetical protein [Bacteroidota bacterium]